MASTHFRLKTATRQGGKSAAAHSEYISREGQYRRGDLDYLCHANYPHWAEEKPIEFWRAADTFERSNGRLYTELEIALPRELTVKERIALVKSFAQKELGATHTYTIALHTPRALDGNPNPHAHVMFCERTIDGIERSPDRFFARANSHNPAQGGAAKNRDWNRKEKISELREEWQRAVNHALETAGHSLRLDYRSYEAQGSTQIPEPKLGPIHTHLLRKGYETEHASFILELRELRSLEAQIHEAERELRLLAETTQPIQIEASAVYDCVREWKREAYTESKALRVERYHLGLYRDERFIERYPTPMTDKEAYEEAILTVGGNTFRNAKNSLEEVRDQRNTLHHIMRDYERTFQNFGWRHLTPRYIAHHISLKLHLHDVRKDLESVYEEVERTYRREATRVSTPINKRRIKALARRRIKVEREKEARRTHVEERYREVRHALKEAKMYQSELSLLGRETVLLRPDTPRHSRTALYNEGLFKAEVTKARELKHVRGRENLQKERKLNSTN